MFCDHFFLLYRKRTEPWPKNRGTYRTEMFVNRYTPISYHSYQFGPGHKAAVGFCGSGLAGLALCNVYESVTALFGESCQARQTRWPAKAVIAEAMKVHPQLYCKQSSWCRLSLFATLDNIWRYGSVLALEKQGFLKNSASNDSITTLNILIRVM